MHVLFIVKGVKWALHKGRSAQKALTIGSGRWDGRDGRTDVPPGCWLAQGGCTLNHCRHYYLLFIVRQTNRPRGHRRTKQACGCSRGSCLTLTPLISVVGFLPEDRGPSCSSVCLLKHFSPWGLFPAQGRVWASRQQRPPQGSLRSRKPVGAHC